METTTSEVIIVDGSVGSCSTAAMASLSSSKVMELIDDKEIASKAVTLVIASARKGLVGLCASVANLLKENAKLEKEMRSLQLDRDHNLERAESDETTMEKRKNVTSPKSQFSSNKKKKGRSGRKKRKMECLVREDEEDDRTVETTVVVHGSLSEKEEEKSRFSLNVAHVHSDLNSCRCCCCRLGEEGRRSNGSECESTRYWRNRYDDVLKQIEMKENAVDSERSAIAREVLVESETVAVATGRSTRPILCPSPLFDCLCSDCEVRSRTEFEKNGESAGVFTLSRGGRRILQIGDRIMISGNRVGAVEYVGHLDGVSNPCVVFVGVRLHLKKGNTDGSFLSKRYFVCGCNFGVFLPLHEVLFLIERKGRVSLFSNEDNGFC